MRNVVAIVGNTGVGKSNLAVEIAQAFNGEVINADALQMYQELPIITNKHPIPERKNINHHLIDFLPWSRSDYTVQSFEEDALRVIDDLHAADKLPVIVGGTHYYIQSLLADQTTISIDGQVTQEQTQILDDPQKVEAELKAVDPVICSKFHPNDTRRLRRALEVYFLTGKRASDIYAEQEPKLRFRVLVFWIQCDREILMKRLDDRVDTMIEQGLVDETKQMYGEWLKYPADDKPTFGIWQVLGYRQFLPYLQGETDSLATGREELQAQTRQYAKRQTKWIRNKLFPSLAKQTDATLATLDSSRIANWDTTVRDRALTIVSEWLQPEPHYSVDLIEDTADVERRQQEFSVDQWVRRKCEQCSARRGEEVWVLGDDAWSSHLKSKGHRASTKKVGPKEYTPK